ncbi:MAG: hypothetical protein GY776_10120 [Alteromonas sp.]|nr:hypothetical protein [Alteromonas sp.]
MITEREKHLMRAAFNAANNNLDFNEWLDEPTKPGATVEDLLSHEADEYVAWLANQEET